MTAILTACYKREEVFKVFLDSLPGDAYLICVGDEGENYQTFINSGIKGEYIFHENKPLGKKWNHGLRECQNLEFEYLVITGSDDIFCPGLWNWYKTLDVHYAGITDLYFMDYPTGRIKYNDGFSANRRGEPHGAGRAIHRNVLESANWKLWDDNINIGLDASMTTTLDKFNLSYQFIKVMSKGFVAMDIKTKDNLHSISEYQGKWVGEDEKQWVLNKIGWSTSA